MPRSFLLTNRRYIPTPPPPDVVNDNASLDANQRSMNDFRHCVAESSDLSNEMIVAQILIRQAEQTEAVNLAVSKPSRTAFHMTEANTTNNANTNSRNNNLVIVKEGFSDYSQPFENGVAYSGHQQSTVVNGMTDNGNDGRFYAASDNNNPRPTVIYSVSSSSNNNYPVSYSSNLDVSNGNNSTDVGMDLSMKADQRSPPPPAPPTSAALTDLDGQDKAGLSDGDSDSGCSTQNEARGHLPPEVEYGWAECHAHFSLLYDLMTQGGRKVPGKEVDQAPYPSKEGTEPAPYDLSQTPTRDAVQEPPVLYELMTESPRKASGRDVPDHAMEVEVSMQQYPPPHHHQQYQQPPQHQQQPPTPPQQQQQQQPHKPYHSQQHQQPHAPSRPQYDDHRVATLQEVPHDRGLKHVSNQAPRYEPRRSLNDLLFAAGLPPVSPPSPPSLSPSTSPLSSEELHTCEECGKRYSTSSNLARHRQTHRSHGDKKARKCPHCDKVYVSMPAFSMHVRTHNQGCACPHCGKRFSRPWLLQGHIRTHTGEKPFACPQCGKSFADKSNLRAHIQTHSSEKPYVCGRCGKAFALKSYLYKHEESSCMRGERFRPLRRQVSAEC